MAEPAPLSHFQRERAALVAQIAENLGKLSTAFNTLNRNIEESISIGSQLEPCNRLWLQFQNSLSLQQVSEPHVATTEDFEELKPGVAPGGGS